MTKLATYNYVWSFMAVTVAIHLAMGIASNNYIRRRHPERWTELGRPSILNNSIANNWASLQFFIFSSAYKKLRDGVINKFVVALRISLAVNFILFMILMSLTFSP